MNRRTFLALMGAGAGEAIRHRLLAGLVVMGTDGKGLLPEVVLGSVSRAVVRHASSRVLLVPGGV